MGGIFFGFAPRAQLRADVLKVTQRVDEKPGAENSKAVLAAGRLRVGITEEKEKRRGRVGGVVKEGREGQVKDPTPLTAENRAFVMNEAAG